jgi:signal transduction histidine kinase
LSISKAIAEAHGGTIDAVSELGKGSTFRLVLPMKKCAPHETARIS